MPDKNTLQFMRFLVVNMGNMFCNTKQFNSDISSWNVSKVTDMSFMFAATKEFNSDLSSGMSAMLLT